MKKLLVYMKAYIKESILGPLFKLLEALLELFVPLVVAAVIDNGIAMGDRAYIVKMCLVLVLLGFVGLAFSITAQYFAAKASVGFTAKLRHVLFEHIQSLSYSELDELGTSTMVTRMTSDMNQVQNGVNLTLRLLLRSPFVVFGAMIMAFTINARAAMIFVYVTVLLLIVVFAIMLCSIPLYKKVQQKLDGVTGVTRENLTGVRVIRAFCKEDEETERFVSRNAELTRSQEFVGRISALMNPVTYIIINLGIIFLINRGAVSVSQGIITQGAVVALYNYMSQILVELIKLANLIINITKSIACGNRIQAALEMKPSVCDGEKGAKESDNAAEFRHAYLRYKNAGDDSLSDIDFSVKKGETVGIIGGTGSGKSSLVNLIPRFYDVSRGEVLVDGINVKDMPVSELRSKIGVVPQKAVLFKGTIRENMLWGNSNASDDDIMEAIKAAQALDVIKAKGGLDCEIEQGGKNLSGGQRQRLTIARALVRKPEILILDDSASALDFATDAALRRSLRELDYSPAVFIVSQRTSSIQHADKIIVLDDGNAVGIGTHAELLESCEVYREIYNSQFKKEAV
ncbi:MAG: ABC transporter ATP-binding protein [Huintestinicola sp.]|uniref:ABC transporter ATP-binding protein n=1 Tax=Huintestinicola sp. TaxID=2981661 RepID=UPI003EFDDF38